MDWKKILGTVAPGLATALGGPLAGLAVQAIGSAFGIESPTPDSVEAAVRNATPEQLLVLKKADQDFKVNMRKLDVDLERIAAQDRGSARQSYSTTKDRMVPTLAMVIVGVLFFKVTVDAALAGALIGYLSAKAEQVVAFYFGSSAGSKGKDDALAQSMKR